MKKVIDSLNVENLQLDCQYDLLVTIMEEEQVGIWMVMNELISGNSVTFPPIVTGEEPSQQIFNSRGVEGVLNYMFESLKKTLTRYTKFSAYQIKHAIEDMKSQSSEFLTTYI